MLMICAAYFWSGMTKSARASGNVRIVSDYGFYHDNFFDFGVVGEVENIGDVAVEAVNVTVRFYDVFYEEFAVKSRFAELNVLLPGRKAPFEITLYDSEGASLVRHYSLSVTWTDLPSGKPCALEILSSYSYFDDDEYLHVNGTVKNGGTSMANAVKVVATFYNSNGTVVGEAYRITKPNFLDPDQSVDFDIKLSYLHPATLVASYDLTAESTEYTLVPELSPLCFLPAFAFLILFVLNKRKNPHSDFPC